MNDPHPKPRRLRVGFTTGTACASAARAALRHLLEGRGPAVVAVRLVAGYYLAVAVKGSEAGGAEARASVIKDAGDDPDVTDKAELEVRLKWLPAAANEPGREAFGHPAPGIYLMAGEGVGMVTKPGLPIRVGEPAVTTGPREMLAVNLTEELLGCDHMDSGASPAPPELPPSGSSREPGRPPAAAIHLPFTADHERLRQVALEVEIRVPKGVALAHYTLNERLGVVGGISILGTTGVIKPFSHEAYEQTIQAALSVARAGGCREVVLSTGGKSEKFARAMLPELKDEAFVQIADFFAFSVQETRSMEFTALVHSVFFGKAVKMAQGHPYTHAHRVPLDLQPLAAVARSRGYDEPFCRELAEANTARHALELLRERQADDVIGEIAAQALAESVRLGGGESSVRLLLFDFDGDLLADVHGGEPSP